MAPSKRILIVDDEPDLRELLEITLGRMGLETESAADLGEARTRLAGRPFDLCLTDLRLPDGTGLELVREIQRDRPGLPVAVITAYGSMETAIEALKAGAFDFVSKPVELDNLRELVRNALRSGGLPAAPDTQARPGDVPPLLGDSPAMRRLKDMIRKVARSQAPVHIHGESGTGKELVARHVHAMGPRAQGPFVAVNCGAIPGELMESEFFGHVKGAFTGATADKPGLFRAAHGGTLFLDEIAELPLDMQVKLLRAIQERAVKPVGAYEETPVDVRILTATHKRLQEEVDAGRFRHDLYFRIHVIELHVPPLRERTEDLSLLADHILQRLAAQWGEPVKTLSEEAAERLRRHPFPGNVRELENLLERAATLCDGPVIHAADLSLPAQDGEDAPPAERAAPATHPPRTVALEGHLAEQQRALILQALEETRWNRTRAAEKLGLTPRQLRYRLRKLGID